jgi:hypothetical protein
MTVCGICARRIDGARLTDPETADDFHPACVAGRIPGDAVVALLAAAALILAPAIVVWAG